jgi:hypothetical protein
MLARWVLLFLGKGLRLKAQQMGGGRFGTHECVP